MSDKLRVDLTGNSSGFTQMLNQAKVQAKAFASSTGAEFSNAWGPGLGKSLLAGIAGAFSLTAVTNLIGGAFRDASNLKDLSEQFDIGSESIQKWEKALGKSGVTVNQFFRSLETLRSNRADARTGGKNKFASLGLSAEAIGTDLTDEDLLKRVLASGGSRSAINDVLGRGGAKMVAALEGVEGEKATFSESDIQNLDRTAKKWESFGLVLKRAFGSIVGSITSVVTLSDEFTEQLKFTGDVEGYERLQGLRARLKKQKERKEAEKDREEQKRLSEEKKSLEQWKANKEYREKTEDEMDRLRNARRGTMSGGARRKDIQQELSEIRDKLKALSGSEFELTTTESSKKRELQTREAELMTALRGNSRQMDFQADSLAKVGLFTSSTVAYNPLMNVQQQQLVQLKRIADRVGKGGF